MDNFTKYWESLTPFEKNALADKASTSYNHLSQVSNGHVGVGNDLGWRLVDADKNIDIAWFKRVKLKSTG